MKRTPRRRSACRSCASQGTPSDVSSVSSRTSSVCASGDLFKKPLLTSGEYISTPGTLSDVSVASNKSKTIFTVHSPFKKPDPSSMQFATTAAVAAAAAIAAGGLKLQHLKDDKSFTFVGPNDSVIYSDNEKCFHEKKEKISEQKTNGIFGLKKMYGDREKNPKGATYICIALILIILTTLFCNTSKIAELLPNIRLRQNYYNGDNRLSIVKDKSSEDIDEDVMKYMKINIKKILVTNEMLYEELKTWKRQYHAFKNDLSQMKSSINFLKDPEKYGASEYLKKHVAAHPCSLLNDSTAVIHTKCAYGTKHNRQLSETDETPEIQEINCSLHPNDVLKMPDFALESSGGSIISTPETETLQTNTYYYVLGLPVWRRTRSPRSIIQNSVAAGECWPFRGSSGTVVIQLAAHIMITAVTMEHIPAALSPTGNVDSAPKKFSIFGLSDISVKEIPLGSFEFNASHSPMQTFPVRRKDEEQQGPFSTIKLWITSNHGNPEYTCVYRFRVHGTLYSNTQIVS